MKKPRICEVLGVEVEERFYIGDFVYWFDQNGNMWSEGGIEGQMACGGILCAAINHPDRIVRKPRFTGQERARAIYLQKIFVNGEKLRIWRGDMAGLFLVWNQSEGGTDYELYSDLFPTIKPGESVTLDEIINQ